MFCTLILIESNFIWQLAVNISENKPVKFYIKMVRQRKTLGGYFLPHPVYVKAQTKSIRFVTNALDNKSCNNLDALHDLLLFNASATNRIDLVWALTRSCKHRLCFFVLVG